jgi:hypothetical protein
LNFTTKALKIETKAGITDITNAGSSEMQHELVTEAHQESNCSSSCQSEA